MYCPKCRKPLFEPDKCRYCDWIKAEEVQPTGIYCYKCGTLIAHDSAFCASCGAKQNIQVPAVEEPKQEELPRSYYSDSRLLMAIVLIIGIIRLFVAFTNGGDTWYKGFMTCLAALIFSPQIKVETNNVVAIFAVKIIAAACVIMFI